VIPVTGGGATISDTPRSSPDALFAAVDPLTPQSTDTIVQRKATCPFIASAVAAGRLPVRNEANNPLASIEDVRQLGNLGGGDLGDLLVTFAAGNHCLMRDGSNQLKEKVPIGLFSLEFPGSQGSHFGHSAILQGDPQTLDSGRFSREDFERLTAKSENGLLKRSEVGKFIAENLIRDPRSIVSGVDALRLLANDLLSVVESVGPAIIARLTGTEEEAADAHSDEQQALTKLAGADNLVGSAGEFGLLFTFLGGLVSFIRDQEAQKQKADLVAKNNQPIESNIELSKRIDNHLTGGESFGVVMPLTILERQRCTFSIL